jgi:hypothetical protein
MVIRALGGESGSQARLLADANSHGGLDPKSPWDSPPDGIEWVLENRAGVQASTLNVLAVQTELDLTRQIIWSLHQHKVPPIALVYGWAHWVVVVDFDASRNPHGPGDETYDIEALHIHDPWREPEEGEDPPPPPPRHVTLSQWRTKYLRQVPEGYWDRKLVAVGAFPGSA